jgi:hypothetical protein
LFVVWFANFNQQPLFSLTLMSNKEYGKDNSSSQHDDTDNNSCYKAGQIESARAAVLSKVATAL